MLERLGYRPWSGRRAGLWLRWWPIARTSLGLVLRRKIFWFFLLLGLADFVVHFVVIYVVTELSAQVAPAGMPLPPILRSFLFTGSGTSYRDFISVQSRVVMILLAFAGAVLVGNEFRFRSLPFYLSRPIGKSQYFLGKLGAAAGLTALVTLVPALLLYLEYGLFSESLEYFGSSQRIFLAILGYGALVSVASGILILAVAALLKKTIPIVVVWGGIFVFLPMVARITREIGRVSRLGDPWQWSLLDFWSLLRWIANFLFGATDDPTRASFAQQPLPPEGLPWASVVLAVWLVAAVLVFLRCARAVEVVR